MKFSEEEKASLH